MSPLLGLGVCGYVQEMYPIINLPACWRGLCQLVTLHIYRNIYLKLDRHFAITFSVPLPHPSSPHPFLEMIFGGGG